MQIDLKIFNFKQFLNQIILTFERYTRGLHWWECKCEFEVDRNYVMDAECLFLVTWIRPFKVVDIAK